jgi:hypothetical protein
MKTVILMIGIYLISFNSFSQKTTSVDNHDSGSAPIQVTTPAFSHDIALVKPLINTNDANGGYYYEYWYYGFHYMFCGAEVMNTGTTVATNVFLEMKIFDISNSYLYSYFSDTIPSILPGETATVNIPGELTFQPWISNDMIDYLIFIVKADSIDENPSNDQQTVPFTFFSYFMWTFVSRSVNLTGSQEISQSTGFQSDDFVGFTFSTDEQWHWVAYLKLYLSEPWPDQLELKAMLFENEHLKDSAWIPLPSPPFSGWIYSNSFFQGEIFKDSTYYVGIKFSFPAGTSFNIGTDTSVYHNLMAETIARINGNWTTLDFVPVMELICDPEALPEKDKTSPVVFPNPAKSQITIDNIRDAKIEMYDFSGKILFTDHIISPSHIIDISGFAPGIYFFRIINKEGITYRKVMIE